MIDFIKKLFSQQPSVNYAEVINAGGLIIDVRSANEYKSGHIKNSINIPLDQLAANLNQFPDKTVPLITCCASGMRSAAAKRLLKSNDFSSVYNAGGWSNLQSKLK